MEGQSWDQFRKMIYIDAPMERVYACWATSGELATWFLEEASYASEEGEVRGSADPAQISDSYRWKWNNYDHPGQGSIVAANGQDHLEFSFADGTVAIDLAPGRGMTLLTLTQGGISEEDKAKMDIHVGCSNGWTFWLANLKAYLEHGILLHDTEADGLELVEMFEFVNM